MRVQSSLLLAFFLSGCVTSSVEEIFGIENPSVGTTAASHTGNFPKIGETAIGETAHLSATQTAAEKQQLVQAASKARAQAAANNQASYRREVVRLRRLGHEQQQRQAATLKAASQ